ncbi:hypothetical protein PR048_004679 [Dryococelus australis]|uniref:Uncharacterized protein n=1 Tax=Dryococelus australis TaxID=614101 RepID=A0ABQ9I622_9NEOP|nr:hypothetical protein PR048_004679 [Dryococelus australis]
MNKTEKVVVQIVNKIRAHPLQRRLFKYLLAELQLQYGELLLHCKMTFNIDGTAAELKIISLRNDFCVKSVSEPKKYWLAIPQEKYPVLTDVALWDRTRLTDEHFVLSISLSVTSYAPKIKAIVKERCCQVSH